jgi:hypothetical protein
VSGRDLRIPISLNIPTSAAFELEFSLTLPGGIALLSDSTRLASGISRSYLLESAPQSSLAQSVWRFRIHPVATTRAGSSTTFSEVMQIVCSVDPSQSMGNYLVDIGDIRLKNLDENETFTQALLRIPIWVTNNAPTGVDVAGDAPQITYCDGLLTVRTSPAERVGIYSLTGALLYRSQKVSGEAVFRTGHLPKGVLIVTGSSGWRVKVVNQ